MGYRIDYLGKAPKKRMIFLPIQKARRIFAWFIVILLAITLTMPRGRGFLWELILPGDEAVTAAALEGMVDNLQQGIPLSDAITTFCREIIYGS